MTLIIKAKRAKLTEPIYRFSDDKELIVFGRDQDKCDVVFLEDQRLVGREHFAMKRVLGRYRLELNRDNLVEVDGKVGMDGQEVGPEVTVRLGGKKGPMLEVHTIRRDDLDPTIGNGGGPGSATLIRDALTRTKKSQKVSIAALALLVLVLLAWGWQSIFGMSLVKRMIKEAAPSVFMVVGHYEKDGEKPVEDHLGSAWAVEKGVFATNAHVAVIFDQFFGKTWKKGEFKGFKVVGMTLRGDKNKARTGKVTKVAIHQGFRDYKLLKKKIEEEFLEEPKTLKFCDVALLYSDDLKTVPPLTCAYSKPLIVGEEIVLIGYPGFDKKIVNPGNPLKDSRSGRVKWETNFFSEEKKPDSKEWCRSVFYHNVSVQQGDSGAPILNSNGEVIGLHFGGRGVVNNRTEFNFGVSVDLVGEMLNKRQDRDKSAIRIKYWEKRFRQMMKD